MLLQELQILPPDLAAQRIDVKRRTIQALAAARETVVGLQDDIEALQMDAVGSVAQRRIRPVVDQKLNYIDCITQMMVRFTVHGAAV